MCGIAGAIWNDPDREVSVETLGRMTACLRHRGPDDDGVYVSDLKLRQPYEATPGVALGFRRLSIIDLAGGHQPLSNEDGTVWIVFNGEIYNYRDLRRRLEGHGHRFRTESDTETIVHLYEDEGPGAFQHLNGMFALAIWDAKQRRLVMARDRLGKKPLLYRPEVGRLTFASELKSLLQVPDAPREIDLSAVDEYLTYQYVPHPNTILKGYRKLPPGHYAIWQDGNLTVQPYWQPDFSAEKPISAKDAVQQLRELFTSAVTLRMRSDVPLGAFLSGGLDSSLVTAVMQQQASEPVKTFSIGFSVAEYDETNYARQVARHLGTDHHEFRITPDAVAVLPQLAWHYDEPFADSSAIPTWYVSKLTREHVTVALSGDGGDELFAGYPRYSAVALGSMIDRLPPVRSFLAASAWQSLPSTGRQKSAVRKFKRFSEALSLPAERRYLDWISIFHERRRAELYSEDFLWKLPDADPFQFLRAAWKRCGQRDAVTCASLADLVTYLPCDLMTKVDTASMAHSLECRAPFLDYRLVEFAASLPLHLKYRWGRGKQLLRAAFADLLPAEIFTRRKMGFGVPLDHWIRHELKDMAHEMLFGTQSVGRGLFRPDAIRQLWDEHQGRTFDHSARLWALVMLEYWQRTWLDSASAPIQPALAYA